MNSKLLDWSQIEDRYPSAILVGNGASINVWPEFAYSSLFKVAKLQSTDEAIFKTLNTSDFEETLSAVTVAKLVCKQEGHDTRSVGRRYDTIRAALVKAVASTHVEWARVPPTNDRQINRALRQFRCVFTTNYDLLIYWAIMERAGGFKDFFWGQDANSHCVFDPGDVAMSEGSTAVLYLHGGLHLYRHQDGTTRKRTSSGRNLLSAFASRKDLPVFVSEGTAKQKVRAIRRNEYLTFARQTLQRQCRRLVVVGHSLRPPDSHITAIIAKSCKRLALSIRPGDAAGVIGTKDRVSKLFPDTKLDFFDATTHPLGDPALQIGP